MENNYIDIIYEFFLKHNRLTLMLFAWLGAMIGHILSIYDKEFKGIHFIINKLLPQRKEIFYDRIDFILLPIIGCILAYILIEPSNYKTAFFAGLTWSGTLVAILKQKG
jgi:hypothetical protein